MGKPIRTASAIKDLVGPAMEEARGVLYGLVREEMYRTMPKRLVEKTELKGVTEIRAGTVTVRIRGAVVTLKPSPGEVSGGSILRSYGQDSTLDEVVQASIQRSLDVAFGTAWGNVKGDEVLRAILAPVVHAATPEIHRRILALSDKTNRHHLAEALTPFGVDFDDRERMASLASDGLTRMKKPEMRRRISVIRSPQRSDFEAFGTAELEQSVLSSTSGLVKGYLAKRLMGGGAAGLSPAGLKSHAMKMLVTSLPHEVWTLAWRSSPQGTRVTVKRLKFVSLNWAIYQEVQRDCPRMLKWFGITFESLLTAGEQREWRLNPQGAMLMLRAFWREQGLSEAAWRFLHRLDGASREVLLAGLRGRESHGEAELSPRRLARLMNRVALVTRTLPRKFIRVAAHSATVALLLEGAPAWCDPVLDILLRRLLDLAKHPWPRGMKPENHPISGFDRWVSNIGDYLRSALRQATTVPPIPKGARAAWLERMSDQWHAEARERARLELLARRDVLAGQRWDSLVRELLHGKFRCVALETGLQLADEGLEMDHCVLDYLERCLQGRSRIFSVQDASTGGRAATVELRSVGADWVLAQVYGPGNTLVAGDVQEAADALLVSWRNAARRRSTGFEFRPAAGAP